MKKRAPLPGEDAPEVKSLLATHRREKRKRERREWKEKHAKRQTS